MLNLKTRLWGIVSLFLLPSLAFALDRDIHDLKSLITYVLQLLNALIPLFFAIAFLAFIWGIIKYLYAAGAKELSEARNYIIFGIIAMTVMLSVLGLANILKNTFFPQAPSPAGNNFFTQTNGVDYQNTDSLRTNPNGVGPFIEENNIRYQP
jgi:hypothetical protein